MRVIYLYAVVLPLSLAFVLPAHARNLNHKLKGDFAVNTTRICAQSQNGFVPPTLQAPSGTSPQVTIIESVQTFNGDGSFTSVGRFITLLANLTEPGQTPIAIAAFTCSGAYQVSGDDTFSQQESCAGSISTGPAAGQTFTSTGGGVTTGRIQGKMILMRNTTATPIAFTFSAFGPFTRICSFNSTGVKIKE